MMILRECVRRHSRLPQILVLDGGREFESIYFETLLARCEVTKKTRPPAKARFGSTCERIFGTANRQFLHNLQGNTEAARGTRQITKSVNPRNHAAWPLKELHRRLCEYAYEIYDTIDHPALGQSPREAFDAAIAQTGSRVHRQITYDQDFLILTLPSTRKGTAKITPGRGIKVNHLYYWSEHFRNPAWETRQVPVRYDPFEVGRSPMHSWTGSGSNAIPNTTRFCTAIRNARSTWRARSCGSAVRTIWTVRHHREKACRVSGVCRSGRSDTDPEVE